MLLEHSHQIFLLDPETMSLGERCPFLVGCNSAAISGKSVASELVTETCFPGEDGQHEPILVRLVIVACHSWSGPFGHFHQTFKCDPTATLSGVVSPFFVGCH